MSAPGNSQAPEGKAMREQSGTTGLGGRVILLVEDHEATAEMVCLLLEDEGYRVEWASTGSQAIERFTGLPTDNHDGCPDLILLDLSLPDMDSAETLERIKQTHHSAPPVIVVSAKPRDIIEQVAEDIGASGILRKHFELDTLLDN